MKATSLDEHFKGICRTYYMLDEFDPALNPKLAAKK
jgi:hypothetical protein